MALGSTLFFLGEFSLARKYEEQGIALYDPQQHHAQAFLYGGTDPGVSCFSIPLGPVGILASGRGSPENLRDAQLGPETISLP